MWLKSHTTYTRKFLMGLEVDELLTLVRMSYEPLCEGGTSHARAECPSDAARAAVDLQCRLEALVHNGFDVIVSEVTEQQHVQKVGSEDGPD